MSGHVKWHRDMKSTHTLIAPQMSPIHFRLLEQLFRDIGFKFEIIKKVTPDAINCGLRCINNDMCYPAILTAGSVVEETLRRDADNPDQNYAIIMTQTGGGCRASQYVSAIRLALQKQGRTDIPVVPLAFVPGGDEKWNQLGLKVRDLRHALYAILLGDVMMTYLYQTRPYEVNPGESDGLVENISRQLCDIGFNDMDDDIFMDLVQTISDKFSLVAVHAAPKPKIGIVGEILLKYHPDANNNLVDIIESEDCEAVVTPIIDFFLYCSSGPIFQRKLLARPPWQAILTKFLVDFAEKRKTMINEICGFHWPSIYDLSRKVAADDDSDEIISLANSMGEGWLLPAEIVDLIQHGCPHVIIAQPFACLGNHATGEGTRAPITERYWHSQILSVNYDPGASATNQLNRIKLFAHDAKQYHEKHRATP